ncbi:hypothetical protein CS022_19770 [Veronia nyctiphanis]|uniref:Tc toxin complex TcA C-terminal TcB-binding domain-containing protein n=1 Tax=Veronia nyctiphanis TaxID=1278244 RepID=A0A4Q0YN42_9GAMM|nr:hypothetical protein CS022_19770 [Veronia nyctiphanis]
MAVGQKPSYSGLATGSPLLSLQALPGSQNLSLVDYSPATFGFFRLASLPEQQGRCYFTVPEEAFDFDFQGHFDRRIRSVSISIPCVVGPSVSINCTLRLLSNHYRVNTDMNTEGEYPQ